MVRNKKSLGIGMLFLAFLLVSVPGVMAADKDYAIEEVKENKRVVTPPVNENPHMVHWLFVECDHWAGCYMPCRGGLKQCMQIAHDANWTVLSVHSRKSSNITEANSLGGPVPLPSQPK